MKKTLLFLAVFMVAVAPFGAHASIASDVGAQLGAAVTELQKRIADLQAIQTVIQADPTALTAATVASFAEISSGTTTAIPRICKLARGLARGSSGDDVTSLQDFLKEKGFFSGESTGFFGRITEEALKKWQSTENIASTGDTSTTGWGSAGPKTRELIRLKLCGKTDAAPGTGGGASNGTGGSTGSSGSSTPKPKPNVCATIYSPVCGLTGSGVKTFGNRCELEVAQAIFVSFGECAKTNDAGSNSSGGTGGSSGSGSTGGSTSGGTGTGTPPPPPSDCPIVTFTPITCEAGQELKPTYNLKGCQTGYMCKSRITLPPPNTGGGGTSQIPDNCKVWFDGCNTCTRMAQGAGPMACTLRACISVNEGESQTAQIAKPYCIQTF